MFGRGIERRAIFSTDRDREHFLELLDGMSQRYRIRIHAYAQMDTHYHGIFQTPEANLSAAMQWFHGSYSAWYNAKHGRVGPLFQGRYRAIAVEDGAWAYPLSLYVHLNPLRIAGLGLDRHGRILESKGWREPTVEQVTERLARLRAYRWSSYRAYGGYERRPDWLETGTLLQQAHSDPARRAAAYRMEARRMLSYGVEPALVERLRDAVAIGSAAYAERFRRSTHADILDGITGKRDLRRWCTVEAMRKAVEEMVGEEWGSFAGRRGHPGCALFLWGLRQSCGLTLREAGRLAGGMQYSAVSKAIRRLELRAAVDAKIRSEMSRLKEVSNVEP